MQEQTLFVNTAFLKFWLKLYFNNNWSEKSAKTRSTCQQNEHFHSSFQHVQGQTSFLQLLFLRVFSVSVKKTRSSCKLNSRWCAKF